MNGNCDNKIPVSPLMSELIPEHEKIKEEHWKILSSPNHPIADINQNFIIKKDSNFESWASSTVSLISTSNEAEIHLKMRRNPDKIPMPIFDAQGNKMLKESESTRTLGVCTMDFVQLKNPGKRSLISIGFNKDRTTKKSDIDIIYNSSGDEDDESESEDGFRRDPPWRNCISLLICLIFFVIIPISTLVIYFAYFYDPLSKESVKPGLFETHLHYS